MIIPPQEKFHRDAYAGEQERDEMLAAIPAPLIIGPYLGRFRRATLYSKPKRRVLFCGLGVCAGK